MKAAWQKSNLPVTWKLLGLEETIYNSAIIMMSSELSWVAVILIEMNLT